MKIRLEMNWFLFWKCGPWKGHHGILNAQGMGSECELDYKKKGKELYGSELWSLDCEPWEGHHWILGKPKRKV